MFELISGDRPQVPRRETMPLIISSAVHALVLGAIAAVPLFYMSAVLPEVPDVMAFVVTSPPPPPPPPPPPAPAAKKVITQAEAKPTNVARAAPIQAPTEIINENLGTEAAVDDGLPGGIEGGVPGGIPGGVVGGLLESKIIPPPPPAPLPQPVVSPAPVRVGGAITAPALLSRVAPEYPSIAVNAKVQGIVILEAIVDRQGRVEDVKVLRSVTLLDAAAIAAVRQWRYSPLLLNGQAERFVLTVSVSFSLDS
jgi:periplasmic protein TonB